jgi:peptidoglycan/LPS O-acetylase OafA/YrhL
VGAGVAVVFATGSRIAPGEWCETLLLLPCPHEPRILPVAWSLWYEILFYAAFAGLFLVPRRAAAPLLIAWAVLVVAVAAAGIRPTNPFIQLAASPFVLEFLAGVLAAWCPVRLSGRQAAGVAVAAAGWCAIASGLAFDPDPHGLPQNISLRVAVFGLPAAAVVFALTGWEQNGGRVKARWLGAVGDASYSIYLLHAPLQMACWRLTVLAGWSHLRVPHTAWLVVMLAAGVLPALLFYRWIERPLMDVVKWKRSARTPTASSAWMWWGWQKFHRKSGTEG